MDLESIGTFATIIGVTGGFVGFVLRLVIKNELASLRDELDDKFVSKEEASLRRESLEKDVTGLDERLKKLEAA